ncbi:trimethylamine methyltransferase family protein [Roseovarius sp. W115]|uniref:Trimethylamine methyltransferase family protein n=1 Tax=Roseovarius rhodophyticola TaxID=3080827 RepID=A0ABZ2TII5_9RHOB
MNTRRSGGRRARAAKRANAAERAFDAAWRQWKNPYAPIEQFSADEIEAIHNASLKVLRDTGIKVLNDEARAFYVKAGMREGEDHVIHFDPDVLMELMAHAPPEVTLHSHNPARTVTIGGRQVGITTSAGSPNCSDLQGGAGPARFKTMTTSAKWRRRLM